MTSDHSLNPQQTPEEQARPLDPNVVQRQASDPESSVWVSASAGTGKTKVLTDRVLRLLLPRADGAPGTLPYKILGITFTKAAANEMSLRIMEKLGHWAIMPLEKLENDLEKLLNKKPTSQDVKAARKLFAQVVDTPGGLKIMTIHSFCKSVLARFPLEANLPPFFSVLDDHTTARLIERAQKSAISALQKENTQEAAGRLSHIAATINEAQFSALMRDIIAERRQFGALLKTHFGVEGLYTQLCADLNVKPGEDVEALRLRFCAPDPAHDQHLKKLLNALDGANAKKDMAAHQILSTWLSLQSAAERTEMLETYMSVFLKKDGEPLKDSITQKVQKIHPETTDIIELETARILAFNEQIKALSCAALTRDLLYLGQAVLAEYEALKQEAAALDYDDLILKTRTILNDGEFKTSNTSWVLYKMDHGLDHILVDEAQDTNPDQWSIIEALCREFFTGQGQKDITRTVFVVGDEKQSIYSFQRASPEEFARMQRDFEKKVTDARERWQPVDMDISFRSTQSVLDAVDSVFADPQLRKGLSIKDVRHHAFRRGDAGRVELWPLCEEAEKPEIDLWESPLRITSAETSRAKLARQIAQTIKGWLKNGKILESKGRPIEPGDIMILVRNRGALVEAISRALKDQNIPVSGSDRMVLNEQLVIEDLLAAAQFALLPADDLTLACVLKSPLIGLDEEQLFALAHTRTGTLWAALEGSDHQEITRYLKNLITMATQARPFEFFSHLLHDLCPADEKSGLRALQSRLSTEILDPVNEFLHHAISFEQEHIASLQSFVARQSQRQDEIKRELSESDNQIRIMTVHGAKGLQAPIVIMPDTVRTTLSPPGQIDKRLIWPDKSTLSVPIWSARKDMDPALFSTQMAALDERLEEEYRRLLYVAMTRAEDRLYVCGVAGRKQPKPSWYHHIQAGLQSHPNMEENGGTFKIENPQINEIKDKNIEKKPTGMSIEIPDFLYKNAPVELNPLGPVISPSRPSDITPAATSPLKGRDEYRFRRGNVTHKLLEILPRLAPDQQKSAAQRFVERFASDLPEDVRTNIVSETLTILEDTAFKEIFSPQARAEVPINARLENGQIMSGQVDRLLITDTHILIIDYKTNRPPPTDAKDIPAIYQAQMQAYADALRKIYPGREVRAALLWTDGPYLMPVHLK
ncbi:MAG: double-strand break repair helicase AddA [Alphaproteobacteria bacterium]|nr:double-strand break repair helicase AddA [Alphaproteobacteria bacterium]